MTNEKNDERTPPASASPPAILSRKKRRWGDAAPVVSVSTSTHLENGNADGNVATTTTVGGGDFVGFSSSPSLKKTARKSRFSSAPPLPPSSGDVPSAPAAVGNASDDPKARAAALQASIRDRLAALKAGSAGGVARSAMAPAWAASGGAASAVRNSPAARGEGVDEGGGAKSRVGKRARVFELDMSATAPVRLVEESREREVKRRREEAEKVNPYLAHAVLTPGDEDPMAAGVSATEKDDAAAPAAADRSSNQVDDSGEILLDVRLSGGKMAKNRPRHRPLRFVEPGKYVEIGEKKRKAAARAAESGYVSGRKDGRVISSVGMAGADAAAIEADDDETGKCGGGGGYYGAGEAGRLEERILSARADAPEVEFSGRTSGGAKGEDGRNPTGGELEAALATAESAMPHAVEWWDAELLPPKLRRDLAAEEGRVIASRARKRQTAGILSSSLGGVKKGDDGVNAAGAKDDGANGDEKENGGKRQQRKGGDADDKRRTIMDRCYDSASLSHSRTHALVQHPPPVLTPAARAALEAAESKSKQSTLHLTKKEMKRRRKLRRAERLRDQQDLQAAGLVPPPEPRLTLSNYMRVLGDQAVLDPSKMEAKVLEQVHARKLHHEKANADRKLTKEQRSTKRARKLAEDVSTSVSVALFYVADMGHPYHRAKVDLNAQQNGITGGVLECESDPRVACVVAEGGAKAIKRYTRLMTVRMKWRGEDFYEEDDNEDEGSDEDMGVLDGGAGGEGTAASALHARKKFNPRNECKLLWTGMAAKRSFHSFMFQSAANGKVARKILEQRGAAHYWDRLVGFAEGKRIGGGGGDDDEGLKFRLGGDDKVRNNTGD